MLGVRLIDRFGDGLLHELGDIKTKALFIQNSQIIEHSNTDLKVKVILSILSPVCIISSDKYIFNI